MPRAGKDSLAMDFGGGLKIPPGENDRADFVARQSLPLEVNFCRVSGTILPGEKKSGAGDGLPRRR
jgi:hypothetical protein